MFIASLLNNQNSNEKVSYCMKTGYMKLSLLLKPNPLLRIAHFFIVTSYIKVKDSNQTELVKSMTFVMPEPTSYRDWARAGDGITMPTSMHSANAFSEHHSDFVSFERRKPTGQ